MSWYFTATGYEVYFNRDELRSRAPARPPELVTADGVRYAAPSDGTAGGSWLAVNEFGIFVSLLNAYPDSPLPPASWTSRGALIRSLALHNDLRGVRTDAARPALDRYRPFTLLALSPVEGALALEWDGRRALEVDVESRGLLCSSSWDSRAATEARRPILRALLSSIEPRCRAHLEFHRSHLPERGALSTCMHRPDARTVSFSQVTTTDLESELSYHHGPPCSAGPQHRVSLQRRALPPSPAKS